MYIFLDVCMPRGAGFVKTVTMAAMSALQCKFKGLRAGARKTICFIFTKYDFVSKLN